MDLPPADNVRRFGVRRWTSRTNLACHACGTPIPPGRAKSPSPFVEIETMDLRRLVLCTGCAPSEWEGAGLAFGRAARWTPRDGWNPDPASEAVAAAERITRTEAGRVISEARNAQFAVEHERRLRESARRAKALMDARAVVANAPEEVPADVRLAARALNVLDELRSTMVTAEANGFYEGYEDTPLRGIDIAYVADDACRWANSLLVRWYTSAMTPRSDA